MTFAEFVDKEKAYHSNFRHDIIFSEDWEEMANQCRGPILGAQDVTDACQSLTHKLNSWVRLIEPHGPNSYLSGPGIQPSPTAIPAYLNDQEYEIRRERESNARAVVSWGGPDRDERPYFQDPQPLSFDPYEAFARDEGEGDDVKVKLAEVWDDPLARTFWIAIKARHITSQHFRGACINMAKHARMNPPRVADDVSIHVDFGCRGNLYLRMQIFPYIVYELMQENRWPYFHPGKACVSGHSLGWKRKEIA